MNKIFELKKQELDLVSGGLSFGEAAENIDAFIADVNKVVVSGAQKGLFAAVFGGYGFLKGISLVKQKSWFIASAVSFIYSAASGVALGLIIDNSIKQNSDK